MTAACVFSIELSFKKQFFFFFQWLFHYFLLESTFKAVYLVPVFIDSEPVIWVLSLYLMCQGGEAEMEAAQPGNIGI